MKKFLLLAGTALCILSCKKEQDVFCTDAVVMWGGDPAADGTGWFLLADSVNHVSYQPQNLPDNLKIDGQPVHVCLYKTGENFYCQCAVPLKKYHITSIRKL
jgi:hypothetical protein